MQCTKAIIPVAGFGTRRLPVAKSVEKCMLPVLNRPVVDYVVEDCIKAGITDIYFVVSKGATQIRDYYRRKPELEAYLTENNKQELIPSVTPPENVQFHFVEQDTVGDKRYGTSIPVWLCREFLPSNERVLVVMGDDFIYNADGSSEMGRLIAAAEQAGCSSLMGREISPEKVDRFGVLVTHDEDGQAIFDYIQEKPPVAEAKSNIINLGRYVLEPKFFEYLNKTVQDNLTTNGEYYITDAINAYVEAGNRMVVTQAQGVHLDSGSLENWIESNNFMFAERQKASRI